MVSQIPNYSDQIAAFTLEFPAAHLVKCGYLDKPKAAGPGWNKPTDHGLIIDHAEGYLVGLVPASIGYSVVDVDQGNPLALALGLMPEYFTNSGTPGHGHLWFVDSESRPNWKWAYTSKAGASFAGEIRGGSGYVVLWEPWILTNGLRFPSLPDLSRPFGDVERWLRPQQVEDIPRARPVAVRTRSTAHALQRAASVIGGIPADAYDTWVTVGQCLEGSARKGEFPNSDAYILWRNWSARSPGKLPGAQEMEQKWASFKGNTPRTLGSLARRG